MKHIDQIQKLMKQSKSISEFTDALKNADIPAWGTIEADKLFKKEHGINRAIALKIQHYQFNRRYILKTRVVFKEY
jgi:hypothetical protein